MHSNRLVLLSLCCIQNQWVEVTGKTLWIHVKTTVLRVKADLISQQLPSKVTLVIRGIHRGLTWDVGGGNGYGSLAQSFCDLISQVLFSCRCVVIISLAWSKLKAVGRIWSSFGLTSKA